MKYFIDCGANKGADVLNFKNNYEFGEDNFWEEYKVYAIEANPSLIPFLEVRLSKYDNVEVLNFAATVTDQPVTFYLGTHTPSSSMMETKTLFMDNLIPTKVPALNLPVWIKENFSADDEIILSMDIEGAEYDIIDNMFENGTIDYIDKLYVEFHGDKLQGFNMMREMHMKKTLIDKFGDNCFIFEYYQHDKFQALNAL